MADITVRPVRTATEMRCFVDLPFRLNKEYPLWTPPLRMMERELLDTGRHPYWRQAERELFLAWRGQEAVGRIAAVGDRALELQQGESIGVWGFFESRDDRRVAMALFDAVEEWHATRSGGACSFLRGPLNPSLNYTCGMLVSGFDRQQPFMMPWTPPFYPVLAESCGMTKERDLLCYRFFRHVGANRSMVDLGERLDLGEAFSIRHSARGDFERDLIILTDLFNGCWDQNWGFSPIPLVEMRHMLRELRLLPGSLRMVFFETAGTPVAAALILRDLGGALRRMGGGLGPRTPWNFWKGLQDSRGMRIFLLGVRKEYRNGAVPFLLMREILSVTQPVVNIDYLDGGWTLEDNDDVNSLCEGMGGELVTRHRMYRRDVRRV